MSWTRIDNAVLDRLPEIDGTAFKVYAVLARHANAAGTCWPAVARIANQAGLLERAVQRSVGRLVALGIVERHSAKGKTTTYILRGAPNDTPTDRRGAPNDARPPSQMTLGGVSNDARPPSQMTPELDSVNKNQEPDPKNKKRAAAAAAECEGFGDWWEVYPRKDAKKAAQKAYGKALKEIAARDSGDYVKAAAFLLDAARAFAGSDAARDRQYTPMPSTWLNQGRFDDDRATWHRGRGQAATAAPTDPTQEEVEAYCREKGYHVNVEKFLAKRPWVRDEGKRIDWRGPLRRADEMENLTIEVI